MNDIINCAKQILENTTEPYCQNIEFFIGDYVEYQDETDFQDLLNVFKRICKEDFDISGFGLYEVPHPSVYIFYNEKKNQMFDVCINNFCKTGEDACISYVNGECENCKADTIQEAIEMYNKDFLQ